LGTCWGFWLSLKTGSHSREFLFPSLVISSSLYSRSIRSFNVMLPASESLEGTVLPALGLVRDAWRFLWLALISYDLSYCCWSIDFYLVRMPLAGFRLLGWRKRDAAWKPVSPASCLLGGPVKGQFSGFSSSSTK